MNKTKEFLKELKLESKSIKLTTEEAKEMHSYVADFVNLHTEEVSKNIRSPYFTKSSLVMAFSSFAIVALIFVGTTFAASSSLPGDALYPIKVNINEQVKGLFITGDAKNAAWHEELISQRLTEAETLASQGKLDEKAQAQLSVSFDNSVKKFNSNLVSIQESDLDAAASTSAHFQYTLQAHQAVLNRLSDEVAKVSGKISSLLGAIDKELASSTEVQANIETKLIARVPIASNEKSSGNSLRLAEESMLKASTTIARGRPAFKISDKLDDARNLIAEGKKELDAKNFKAASVSFTKAKLMSDQAKILVEVSQAVFETASTTTPTITPSATTTPSALSSPVTINASSTTTINATSSLIY